MVVVAWGLFVVFGFFALLGWLKYLVDGVNLKHLCLISLWSVITALSAGVIWGGLFQ